MKVRLSNKALVIVDALVATGLYGQSRDECAERLLYERLWQVQGSAVLGDASRLGLGRWIKGDANMDAAATFKATGITSPSSTLDQPPPLTPAGYDIAPKGHVAKKGDLWWYPQRGGKVFEAVVGARDRGTRPALLITPTKPGRKPERHRGRTALERGVNVKPIHTMAKVRPGLYNYRGYAIEQRAGEWVVLVEDGTKRPHRRPKIAVDAAQDRRGRARSSD